MQIDTIPEFTYTLYLKKTLRKPILLRSLGKEVHHEGR